MQRTITLLVLGDLGRSPRMMYHLESFLKENFKVSVISYLETPIPDEIRSNPNASFYPLKSPSLKSRHQLPKPLFLCYSLLRVIKQFFILFNLLFRKVPRSDFILTQNPPSFPTLVLASWVSRWKDMKLVIDWHNFGYSILGLRFGEHHFLVRSMKWIEKHYAKNSDAHLCVSEAMKDFLQKEWGLKKVTYFYDHAPENFRTITSSNVLTRLNLIPTGFDQAKIVVSSSSWTKDENFDHLLSALKIYDNSNPDQKLLVILTGKGAGRSEFDHKVISINLKNIKIKTIWLEKQDYIELLSAVDLGISLHISSSGLDLPMKISDMLGAGLPVCAYDYGDTIREQIQVDKNGILFKSPKELSQHLTSLFNSGNSRKIESMQAWCKNNHPEEWHSHWMKVVDPLFKNHLGRIGLLHHSLGLGGGERWLLDTAVSFQQAGYDVEILTGKYDQKNSFDELNLDEIPVKVLGSKIPKNIGQYFILFCTLLMMALVSLRIRFGCKKYDSLIIDMVSHTIPLLGNKIAKRKIFYGHFPDKYLAPDRKGLYVYYRKMADRIEEYGLASTDQIFVNSQFTQGKFKEAFPKIKTQVCYPGINLDFYKDIDLLPTSIMKRDKIILLMVSRISPDKNLKMLIETMVELRALVSDRFEKIELSIAGGYNDDVRYQIDELNHLKSLIKLNQLDDQVKFHLNCTDIELLELYRSSSVLLYSPPFEHFGLVPLEAMASARPVVASNKGGPTETVIDGETGFLIDTTAEEFSRCVQQLIQTPGLARKMGEAGRVHVIKHFDRKQQSLKLLGSSSDSTVNKH